MCGINSRAVAVQSALAIYIRTQLIDAAVGDSNVEMNVQTQKAERRKREKEDEKLRRAGRWEVFVASRS